MKYNIYNKYVEDWVSYSQIWSNLMVVMIIKIGLHQG